MRTWASRYGLLLVVLGCLTACGRVQEAAAPTMSVPARLSASTATAAPRPLDSTATTSPRAVDTGQATSIPAGPTATPLPTFLPEHRVSITLRGRTWWLNQPDGIAPMVAQGTDGVLWMYFPYTRRFPDSDPTGEPRPLTDYFIMYTPLAGSGDDLGATSYRIATLPSELDTAVRHLVSLSAIEQNRFLLISYRLCQGCQNGATQEFWRVDPQHYGQPASFISVLERPGAGGGHFVTFAVGPRWLFWSESDLNVSNASVQVTDAFLLDLRDGTKRSISLTIRRVWDRPSGMRMACSASRCAKHTPSISLILAWDAFFAELHTQRDIPTPFTRATARTWLPRAYGELSAADAPRVSQQLFIHRLILSLFCGTLHRHIRYRPSLPLYTLV
jgi:hypothetical protein